MQIRQRAAKKVFQGLAHLGNATCDLSPAATETQAIAWLQG
jgi:hypothetical protein